MKIARHNVMNVHHAEGKMLHVGETFDEGQELVSMDANDFQSFMEAHQWLMLMAEQVASGMDKHGDLKLAIEAMRKLEGNAQ